MAPTIAELGLDPLVADLLRLDDPVARIRVLVRNAETNIESARRSVEDHPVRSAARSYATGVVDGMDLVVELLRAVLPEEPG